MTFQNKTKNNNISGHNRETFQLGSLVPSTKIISIVKLSSHTVLTTTMNSLPEDTNLFSSKNGQENQSFVLFWCNSCLNFSKAMPKKYVIEFQEETQLHGMKRVFVWMFWSLFFQTLKFFKEFDHYDQIVRTTLSLTMVKLTMVTVMANFWARVLCSLAVEGACFRMRITLEVVLIRSLVFYVCVSQCSRNGSGVLPYQWVQEKFV